MSRWFDSHRSFHHSIRANYKHNNLTRARECWTTIPAHTQIGMANNMLIAHSAFIWYSDLARNKCLHIHPWEARVCALPGSQFRMHGKLYRHSNRHTDEQRMRFLRVRTGNTHFVAFTKTHISSTLFIHIYSICASARSRGISATKHRRNVCIVSGSAFSPKHRFTWNLHQLRELCSVSAIVRLLKTLKKYFYNMVLTDAVNGNGSHISGSRIN